MSELIAHPKQAAHPQTSIKRDTSWLSSLFARSILLVGGKVIASIGAVLLLVVGGLFLIYSASEPAMLWAGLVLVVAIVLGVVIWRPFGIGLSALTAAAIVAVLVSQLTAGTPPITDANGKPVPGSVAEMRTVRINNTDQWIVVRGRDATAPVLLYLAGGPGGTETGWFRKFHAELENHFVVVNWEQPGAGKSSSLLFDSRGLTLRQYVADGLQLTNYLRQRFHHQKIYLVGHSWGTMLGVWMAQQHPELFYAYVGVAQMVNPTLSDRLGYEDVLARAQRDGNSSLVQKLQADGPPPYDGVLGLMKYLDYMTPQNDYMVAEEQAAGATNIYLGNPLDNISSPEYGLAEKIGSFMVLNPITYTVIYPQLKTVDFTTQVQKLDVPVYFVQGRHDLNNWAPMVDQYYQVLQSPHKELIWSEKYAHNVLYEDPAAFDSLMVNKVLAETLTPGSVASN